MTSVQKNNLLEPHLEPQMLALAQRKTLLLNINTRKNILILRNDFIFLGLKKVKGEKRSYNYDLITFKLEQPLLFFLRLLFQPCKRAVEI